jgi:Na+/H+ antiporter NhaA
VQRIATQVFISSSLLFGILGILVALVEPDADSTETAFDKILLKCFFITVFIILPSFALSVAGKYLSSKDD